MTLSEFTRSFSDLENAFGGLDAQKRQFYYRQFQHSLAWAFDRACRRLIAGRDDRYGFPLVAELNKTIDMVLLESPTASEKDIGHLDYCQRCENSGLYLNARGGASLCDCRSGRLKQARLRVGISARRAEVDDELAKLPPAEPPIRDLKEKHPLGFWEDTQAIHDEWVEAKVRQISVLEEIVDKRKEGRPIDADMRKRLLREAVAECRGKMEQRQIKDYKASAAGERERGEDDDAPF